MPSATKVQKSEISTNHLNENLLSQIICCLKGFEMENQKGNFKKIKVGNYIYIQQESDKTNQNLKYLFDKGIGFHSHPADWLDIFFPQKRTQRTRPNAVTIHELTSWTNIKAMKMNAGVGGGIYKIFVNFSTEEIRRILDCTSYTVFLHHPKLR